MTLREKVYKKVGMVIRDRRAVRGWLVAIAGSLRKWSRSGMRKHAQ